MAASNIFSQVTPQSFEVNDIKLMNKVLRYLLESIDEKLRYAPLNMQEAQIIVFSDGSHATNADGSSQLGYMVLLTDYINWHISQYKSYKSRRIVRSPLAAETLALADAADAAILIQHDLADIHGFRIPLTMLTDAKYLFDVLSKRTSTTEKRLMIYIESTRQSYDEYVLNNLGCIRREYNISDSLTKIYVNEIMKRFMMTGKLEYQLILLKWNNTSLEHQERENHPNSQVERML